MIKLTSEKPTSDLELMKIAIKIAVVLPVAFYLSTAAANPKETLIAFDGLCVSTGGNLADIERLAKGQGAIAVPNDVLVNNDPAIAKLGGKGFAISIKDFRYMVIVTNAKTCSVLAPYTDADALIKLIEANYELATPYIDRSGVAIKYSYRIKSTAPNAGSYIGVTYPKPGFDETKYMSIGFIPKNAADKLGIGRN